MSFECGWVTSAITNTEAKAVLLNEPERRAVVTRLRERLGVDVTEYWPWERREPASEGRRKVDGWKLIPMYVGAEECLMFLEEARAMWKFRTGSDLLRVLGDCPGFEFYVCDEPASYLLCHNHHDYIIGWGRVASWVEGLQERL